MTDDEPKPDPKPLTTEYHRAHKQLMLWSAIPVPCSANCQFAFARWGVDM